MKFKLIVKKANWAMLAHKACRQVGLDDIDTLREYLGVPNLSIDLIDGQVKESELLIRLVLTEDEARKFGGYRKCNELSFIWDEIPEEVTKELLNCIYIDYKVDRNSITGEVTNVVVCYKTNHAMLKRYILQNWKVLQELCI